MYEEFKWGDLIFIAQLPFRDVTKYNVRAEVAGWGQSGECYTPEMTLKKLSVEILHPVTFHELYPHVIRATSTDIFYYHQDYNRGQGTAHVRFINLFFLFKRS